MDLSSWRHFYRQTGLEDERMTKDKFDAMFDIHLSNNQEKTRHISAYSCSILSMFEPILFGFALFFLYRNLTISCIYHYNNLRFVLAV
jgi:hypothetical protein